MVVLAVVLVKVVIPDAVSVPTMEVALAARVDTVVLPAERTPVTMLLLVNCPEVPIPPVTTRAPVPVVVLAVPFVKVVIPDAERAPVTMFPAVTCPVIPAPPVTRMAPVVVLVLAVPLVKLEIPENVGVLTVAMTPEVTVMLFPPV